MSDLFTVWVKDRKYRASFSEILRLESKSDVKVQINIGDSEHLLNYREFLGFYSRSTFSEIGNRCVNSLSSDSNTRGETTITENSMCSLGDLFKFVQPFSGKSDYVFNFLNSCTQAMESATEEQKPVLFRYIQTQIKGDAQLILMNKEFSGWEDLKSELKTVYQEPHSALQLHRELVSIKQGHDETVVITQRPKTVEEASRLAQEEEQRLNMFKTNTSRDFSNRNRLPKALIDTGADVSLILKEKVYEHQVNQCEKIKFNGIGGISENSMGKAEIDCLIGNTQHSIEFHVVERYILQDFDALLGIDFLKRHEASFNFKNNILTCGNDDIKIENDDFLVPSRHEVLRFVRVNSETVEKNELNVKIGMKKNVLLIKEINNQSKMINMEQDTIKSWINEIINEIEEANNHANEHEKLIRLELYYEKLFSKINHKIEVTDTKVETFRDSIIFTNGNSTSVYFRTEATSGTTDQLQGKYNLAIDPLISNYQQLMKNLKLKAFIKKSKYMLR
ncbi:unnamed protein product [Hermetia illucens]|uniref:Peptidase A2 domain-containing protein n=1 Tax=Hermetia illucens TaxID=343691 RepID=A0A7R8UJ11_HERIL|nr:unnamed protein product [Hermetia illucens]